MNLIDKLDKASDESEIEKISAYIADDARNEIYSLEQIGKILSIYNKLDLLSLKYDTREQILYTITEIANAYQIKGLFDLKSITDMRDLLEDDLKEYVDEIINVYKD